MKDITNFTQSGYLPLFFFHSRIFLIFKKLYKDDCMHIYSDLCNFSRKFKIFKLIEMGCSIFMSFVLRKYYLRYNAIIAIIFDILRKRFPILLWRKYDVIVITNSFQLCENGGTEHDDALQMTSTVSFDLYNILFFCLFCYHGYLKKTDKDGNLKNDTRFARATKKSWTKRFAAWFA